MAESSFNISELIRRLGLKNVSGMEITERLQPTVQVADLGDLLPPLQSATGVFAGDAIGVIGDHELVEVSPLAPGGCWIDELWYEASATRCVVYDRVGPPLLATAPLAPVITLSTLPPVSRVRAGTVLPTGLPGLTLTGGFFGAPLFFVKQGWYVPPGSILSFESVETNPANFLWGIRVRDVPASEHVPS